MNKKPLIIVMGEPYSTFSEILFKFFRSKKFKNLKYPIVMIGSKKLVYAQMKKLNYSKSLEEISVNQVNSKLLNKKKVYIINVNFKFKKIFDKINYKSKVYIEKCFDLALKILNKKNAFALVNGPISKKHFLKKKYLGVTEYLASKTKSKNYEMFIYNSNISVSPINTHLPIKLVSKNLSKKKIINNSKIIYNFYRKNLNINPKIAVLGLNPHCETIDKKNEENKIIIPSIKIIKNKKIRVFGPFSADTFFFKKNLNKFDVVVGMYHDQVLTPLKTLYNFDAINITLGLPFIRISPDHGTNNQMIGKNISNPQSLIAAINFLNKI